MSRPPVSIRVKGGKAAKPEFVAVTSPDLTTLQELSGAEVFGDGALLENCSLASTALPGISARALALKRCGFSRVGLAGADLQDLQAHRVQLNDCDLANASFIACSIDRAEFNTCRMTGAVLTGYLQDVLFDSCKLTFANFRFAELKNVIFRDCDLRGSDFHSAKLENVSFERCNLSEGDFQRCTFSGLVDMRTSEVAGLRSVLGMTGATIDSGQLIDLAPQLAQAFGFIVEK